MCLHAHSFRALHIFVAVIYEKAIGCFQIVAFEQDIINGSIRFQKLFITGDHDIEEFVEEWEAQFRFAKLVAIPVGNRIKRRLSFREVFKNRHGAINGVGQGLMPARVVG